MTFLQALMNQGRFRGGQLLQPKTVTLMNQNQIGDIAAGILKTTAPPRSNDVDFFPGIPCRWGLAYMINTQPGPNGRSAGTVVNGAFVGVCMTIGGSSGRSSEAHPAASACQ